MNKILIEFLAKITKVYYIVPHSKKINSHEKIFTFFPLLFLLLVSATQIQAQVINNKQPLNKKHYKPFLL